MRDRPNGIDLLEIARNTLLRDILPHVAQEQRYQTLMVANAMANAYREMRSGETPLRAELKRLRQIYGDVVDPPDADDLSDFLLGFRRRLARDIRAGRLDGERLPMVQQHLIETAKAKVAETNPKYLESLPPILGSTDED